MIHLPELSSFLAVYPGSGPLSDFPERLLFLIETLGTILAGLRPVGFKQFVSQRVIRFGNRHCQLRRQVAANVDEVLRNLFAPAVAKVKKDIKKEVARAAVVVEGRTKTINTVRFTVTKMAELASLPQFTFLDLGADAISCNKSGCSEGVGATPNEL